MQGRRRRAAVDHVDGALARFDRQVDVSEPGDSTRPRARGIHKHIAGDDVSTGEADTRNAATFRVDGDHLIANERDAADLCTPISIAWDLHKAWPEASYRPVAGAGHAMTEPGIVQELVTATEEFKSRPA
jgi:hypothetical protein